MRTAFKRVARRGLSFCPLASRVRVMCACACAYYKGHKDEGSNVKGKPILFLFSKKRTKGQEEIKDEGLELKGSGLRGDCAFVLFKIQRTKKGQKDKKRLMKDESLKLKA